MGHIVPRFAVAAAVALFAVPAWATPVTLNAVDRPGGTVLNEPVEWQPHDGEVGAVDLGVAVDDVEGVVHVLIVCGFGVGVKGLRRRIKLSGSGGDSKM